MQTFLVEAYQTSDAQTSSLARLSPTGSVRYVRTIFVPGDEIGLHLFAAPSAEAVREALERIAFAYERLVEATTDGTA